MKTYPSIPRCPTALDINAHTFVKYDGSNLRFEYSKKKDWYKFGTRHRLFDKTDPIFGPAIKLFKSTIGEDLKDTLRQQWPGAKSFLVFCEYFGRNSFAGQHVDSDAKELRLIDANPFQQGILGPEEFIKVFGAKEYVAKYLGENYLDKGFIDSIRNAESIYEYHYEGVICKWGEKNNLQMVKIKTLRYLMDLQARIGEDWEKYES